MHRTEVLTNVQIPELTGPMRTVNHALVNKTHTLERMELPPFGGHSIIGREMPVRRCSHAPHQAGLPA
jgi:hypothetical protein